MTHHAPQALVTHCSHYSSSSSSTTSTTLCNGHREHTDMGSPDHDQTRSSAAQHNLLRPPQVRLLAPSRVSQGWEVTSRAAEAVEVAAALILSPQARKLRWLLL